MLRANSHKSIAQTGDWGDRTLWSPLSVPVAAPPAGVTREAGSSTSSPGFSASRARLGAAIEALYDGLEDAHLGNVRISSRQCAEAGGPSLRDRYRDSGAWAYDIPRGRRASATFLPGGVRAHGPQESTGGFPEDVRRGVVQGFSAASRRRLRLRLMEIDWGRLDAMWVTLTYHKEWDDSWTGWKRDLGVFRKRLARSSMAAEGIIWRMEFQKRGAPHFHLVLGYAHGLGPDRAQLRGWVRDNWAEVIGESDNEALLEHGTDVVTVQVLPEQGGMGKLMGYLLKEMSKKHQAGVGTATGRVWGVSGNWPVRELGTVSLTEAGYFELARRIAERCGPNTWFGASLSGEWPGFCYLGDGGELLNELLEDLPGGVEWVTEDDADGEFDAGGWDD